MLLAGSKLLPSALRALCLLFFPVHCIPLCLVPSILVAAGLIVYTNWKCNLTFRYVNSSLGSWTKPSFPLPPSTFISGAWSNFLESLAEYTLLGPSLMGRGGPEDRSWGLFPSLGRLLPIEAVTCGFVLCSPGRRLLPDSCRLPLASGSCWRKSCPPDAAPSLPMALRPWRLPMTGLSVADYVSGSKGADLGAFCLGPFPLRWGSKVPRGSDLLDWWNWVDLTLRIFNAIVEAIKYFNSESARAHGKPGVFPLHWLMKICFPLYCHLQLFFPLSTTHGHHFVHYSPAVSLEL